MTTPTEVMIRGPHLGPHCYEMTKRIKADMRRKGYTYLRTERNQIDTRAPSRMYFIKKEEG